MIYTFIGDKTNKAREKAHHFIEVIKNKRPEAPFFLMQEGNASLEKIEELSEGQGLFFEKQIIFADQIFENEKIKEEVGRLIPLMAKSSSIFIILEIAPIVMIKKLLEKHSLEIKDYSLESKKKEEFNIFSLTDALINRDKLKLWTLFLEAEFYGKTPEEIHGTLLWQAKSMALVNKTKNANEAGLKPFVYGKSLRAKNKYSNEEIESLPWNLVELLHNSRLKSRELGLSLEKWMLNIQS